MARFCRAIFGAVALVAGGALAISAETGDQSVQGGPTTGQIPDFALPYFLGEVVVSSREDGEAPPGTTDTIEPETAESAGAVNLAEALELLPGVSMSTGARNEQKIWVRGYEQSNVLVLVDGVPVSDPYYGDLDLGQLPIFDVARISVTRGAASPLYGPNGLGGVINVVTAQGGEDPGVSARLSLSDNSTYLAHAAAGGTDGTLSWYLGAGLESSDGWDLADDFAEAPFQNTGRRVNSDLERSTLLARIGWRPDPRSSLYASFRWVDAEKGIPFHTTEPAGFVRFARFSEWRQATVGLGYERRFEGGFGLRGQLYGLGFENTLDVYEDPELDQLQLISTFSDRVYGGYVIGDWSAGGGHWLSASLHVRQDRHTTTESLADGTVEPDQRYRAWTSSLAVEDRWRVSERIGLVGSLAVERLRVDEAQTLRPGGEGDELADDPLAGDTLMSPQLQLRTQLGGGWEGTAAIYGRSRFPSLRQLYGTEPPNPDLEPQRSTGVDLGASWSGARLRLRGNIFADRVRDLITRQSRAEPYRNQDEAEIRGVELRLDGSAGRFQYQVGWTGLDAEFTSSSEGMDEIPYVPRHQVEVLAGVRLGRRVDLRGSWLVTGERVFYDRGVKRDLDGYRLLGIELAGHLDPVRLSIRVDNLLDANVEQEDGFPLPGRRLWAGVRFSIDL